MHPACRVHEGPTCTAACNVHPHGLCQLPLPTTIPSSLLSPPPPLEQDIIQQTPPSLRSKAARLVGAKCTLLARIDAYGQVGPGMGVGEGLC